MNGPNTPSRLHAEFVPQAWINDYAVRVDAEGETEWMVSQEFLRSLSLRHVIVALTEPFGSYEADEFKDDPAAPEWVREWHGPHEVELTIKDKT